MINMAMNTGKRLKSLKLLVNNEGEHVSTPGAPLNQAARLLFLVNNCVTGTLYILENSSAVR
jgi:hypothetical protein